MLAAVEAALPADIAVFAAAVADWRPAEAGARRSRRTARPRAAAARRESRHPRHGRPHARRVAPLVVGFAAETDAVLDHARAKIARKGCDLIVANDVSAEGGVMGGPTTPST